MKIDVILDPDSSPDEVCQLGLLAESYGIHGVWTSNYPSSRDPFISLCPLALASSTIRLGPLVVTPYEMHPYKIAKALASLNELCGGRAQILTGGPTGVNATMGAGFSRMVGRTRECVEIMKGANAENPLNYEGDIYQVKAYQPTWATDEPPFIYVGANKAQMVRLATRVADGLMLGDTTEQRLNSSLQLIAENLNEHGRSRDDLRVSCLVAWHVKQARQDSVSEARRHLALRGMLDIWFLETFLDEDECRVVDESRGNIFKAYKQKADKIDGVPEEIVEKLINNLSMCGDHSDIDRHIKTLHRYRAMGLDAVALKLHEDQEAAIRTIGEHIVPALG
jgi:alkanesulfonate monooxygenase SsuD/methylene tetrahydromethanopterin reductase-like flavin-dependent oxidoreductase (luciferase family)